MNGEFRCTFTAFPPLSAKTRLLKSMRSYECVETMDGNKDVLRPGLFDNLLYALVVFANVFLEELCGFGVSRGVRVGIAQEALDGCENGRDVVDWAPVAL